MFDATKSYLWSFTVSGIFIIVSGIISILSVPVANCFNKDEKTFQIGDDDENDVELDYDPDQFDDIIEVDEETCSVEISQKETVLPVTTFDV